MVAANKKTQAAISDAADEDFAEDPLPEMKEPGSKQTALQIAGVPQRDKELEEAFTEFLNAENALIAAKDNHKATYAEAKRLMRLRGFDEYRMFDANETFFLKQNDAEIKHKPTSAADAAQQTH